LHRWADKDSIDCITVPKVQRVYSTWASTGY